MAEEEAGAEVLEDGGKKKKMIIIAVAVLLIAAGAGLYFTGFFEDEAAPVAVESNEEGAGETSNEVDDGETTELLYHELKPPFMVNFSKGSIKVLRVTLSLMAKSEKAIDAAKSHDPVIRNNILMLLSGENLDVLKTADGKEKLQTSIKEEINKVLEERKASAKIDEVFFTELVMQ